MPLYQNVSNIKLKFKKYVMDKNLKPGNYLFIIPVIFILIVKIPHLALPYFWDEAWSYFTAIHKMYENGPGILPGALPLNIAKGHPLFFFFLYSVWMKIFGSTVTVVHILSLLISVSTLLAIYFMVKKHVNQTAALISMAFMSVQSLFLAQATLALPEVLITLFLIVSIDFYLRKKYLLFALVASLMVLTKETSIVFIIGFSIFHFFSFIFSRPKEWKKYFLESLILVIPALTYLLFLFIHKIKFGTCFYETHLSYIQITKYDVMKKLRISFEMLYDRYGRFAILYSLVPAVVFSLFKNRRILHVKILALLILQTVLFIAFSIFNFYTYRYMIGLMALFMIFSGIILQQAATKSKLLNGFIVMIIIAFPTYFSFATKTNSDIDLGYVEAVKVHQQVVDFCETQKWEEKSISASFNLIYYLRDPSLGYLNEKKPFSNVSDLVNIRDSEIFLIDCTNNGKQLQIDTVKNEYQLVKRYQLNQAWGEIYTNLEIQ